jgi:hypothetical protein
MLENGAFLKLELIMLVPDISKLLIADFFNQSLPKMEK